MNFKEGDKVKVKKECSGTIAGEIYTLVYGDKNGNDKHQLWAWKNGELKEVCSLCGCPERQECGSDGRCSSVVLEIKNPSVGQRAISGFLGFLRSIFS